MRWRSYGISQLESSRGQRRSDDQVATKREVRSLSEQWTVDPGHLALHRGWEPTQIYIYIYQEIISHCKDAAMNLSVFYGMSFDGFPCHFSSDICIYIYMCVCVNGESQTVCWLWSSLGEQKEFTKLVLRGAHSATKSYSNWIRLMYMINFPFIAILVVALTFVATICSRS